MLEAWTNDVVVAWIQRVPKVMENDVLRKLKVPVGEYLLLSAEEQPEFILRELRRSLSASERYGINRFEAVLDALDLSGPIPESRGRALYELSHLRNVILHRGGIADKRFVEACPQLGFAVGDRVTITSEHFLWYTDEALSYARTIIIRAGIVLGVEPKNPDERKLAAGEDVPWQELSPADPVEPPL